MMPPIVFTLLQGLFLLLLYIFVARAVRAVVRDVAATPAAQPARTATAASRPAASAGATKGGQKGAGTQERPKRIEPRQLVVHSPEGRPQVLTLDGSEITFGRGDQASVPLGDPYTSDRHARVYHDGRRWLVSDLGSTNGTFVNQVKVTAPTPIAAGDQLGIGRTVVEVRK